MLMLGVCCLLVIGCASPPEAEQKAAREAASAARSAGAEQYAPSEFIAMTAAVKKAEAEMAAKAYKDAKVSYTRVKTLADTAARTALTGKAAMREDLEKQLSDLVQRWEDLEGQAQVASKQMRAVQKRISDADARTVVEQLETAKTAVGGDLVVAKQRLALASAALDKGERHLAARGVTAGKSSAKVKP
jgi:chaperonin cofactor prefoldin